MLPSPSVPMRPRLREWLVMVCALFLLSVLSWAALNYIQMPHVPPEIQTGLDDMKANDIGKARAVFDHALSADPGNADSYLAICLASAGKKQWAMQLEYARRGVEKCTHATEVKRSQLYAQIANALTEAKPANWQEQSIQAAKQAYNLDPQNPAIANLYGYILGDLRNDPASLQQAETLTAQAIRDIRTRRDGFLYQADLAVTLDSFGWVRYKRGDREGAANALIEAINTLPAEAQSPETLKMLYYHLGVVHRAAGRTEEARNAFQRSLAADPTYSEAQKALNALPAAP